MLLEEFEARIRLGDPKLLDMRIWRIESMWHICYGVSTPLLCSGTGGFSNMTIRLCLTLRAYESHYDDICIECVALIEESKLSCS